uniref:Uncharacterized protein n=1 Tax=Arundo donax TaxID=35708 RepID=A0A0A9BFE6_ARUDO
MVDSEVDALIWKLLFDLLKLRHHHLLI